ncbi:MarR family transcriptional regulator [Fictibacillus iocasae]|uniref:MarR family transcriptional regulator n=1 Tax=Fictibacillus iocasae TaxID=2715437 RepID=A0ABW2NQY8_9BACL
MSELANLHMMLNYMRGVYKVLEEDWQKSAKSIGLTQAEQHVLWIVHLEQEVTVSRIAQIGLWDVSTVMQVIKRLREKNLVEVIKKNSDRRVSYVKLSEEGVEKQKQSANFQCKLYDFIKVQMEDESKKTFMADLIRFHKELNDHFHGSDYVEWIVNTGKALEEAR